MRATWLVLLLVPLAGCLESEPAGEPEPEPMPAMTWLTPVDLECPDYPQYRNNCGAFGEPQLEVQGDGTIWYSAVCCVGQSPPIWRSFDGGLTFEPLENLDGTGGSRDAFGIEGDFAVDDVGNVYFFDISLATTYFTKFAPDGTHVHTKADVFEPLVDRPWVRAGAEDEVFIAYNTGSSTWFYRSDNGGLTWDRLGAREFPCALMALGQGAERDHLIMAGCPGNPAAWITRDGGQTWSERIDLGNYDATEFYMQPAADASGLTYVPVTYEDDDQTMIDVVVIDANNEVVGQSTASFTDGLVDKPWLVAGKEGHVALAYYGARDVDQDDGEDAQWYLHVSHSQNASADEPAWRIEIADETMVHEGTFGRALGDFLQLRQTPDGDLVVAYAMKDDAGTTVNRFVRGTGIDFGPEVFRNGPQ